MFLQGLNTQDATREKNITWPYTFYLQTSRYIFFNAHLYEITLKADSRHKQQTAAIFK